MKHIYLFGFFIIASLLFTGCSPKETFYFSRSQDRFRHYKKEKQLMNLPDHNDILTEPSVLNQPSNAYKLIISAANESATNLERELLLKQPQVSNLNASLLNKKVELYSYEQAVKSKKLQKNIIKKRYLKEPATDKKVNELALAGFLLSLGYIGFLITSSGLVLILGLIGSVVSLFGLIGIKKNPDKYSGKGFAWAGIIMGLLFTLFMVGFILAFAGAF